jgi:hypothetical protein
MPSFRFCRPDDISLLVEAVNRCYDVHFPNTVPVTLEEFKSEIKHLNLWSSSCMLALDDNDPVGVLIAAKRESSSLILRLGIHPNYGGNDYGHQLVTSLIDKMAVLGPPLLTVVIPDKRKDLSAFFGKLEFTEHRNYGDFATTAPLNPPTSAQWITPVELEDLGDRYLRKTAGENKSDETLLAWERRTQTLNNRKKGIKGIGIPDVDGIAAYLFYVEDESDNVAPVKILGLGCKKQEKETMLLGLLIQYLSNSINSSIEIPKLSAYEVDISFLKTIGFRKTQSHTEYGVTTTKDK